MQCGQKHAVWRSQEAHSSGLGCCPGGTPPPQILARHSWVDTYFSYGWWTWRGGVRAGVYSTHQAHAPCLRSQGLEGVRLGDFGGQCFYLETSSTTPPKPPGFLGSTSVCRTLSSRSWMSPQKPKRVPYRSRGCCSTAVHSRRNQETYSIGTVARTAVHRTID